MSGNGSPRPPGITAGAATDLVTQVPYHDEPLAIVGAGVIDATRPRPRPRQTVLVEHGRIVAVGPSKQVEVPADFHRIDAIGKYLLPGLWDMHVHQFDPSYLQLHLRHGVTGIRHMGGIPDHHRWREQVSTGELTSPRMVVASPIIDGPTPLRPGSIAVADASEARRAVARCDADGADFIKVYNLVPRDAYLALVHECRRRDIPFAGHLPLQSDLAEASRLGQASVEHLEGLLLSTSHRRDELHRQLRSIDAQTLPDMAEVRDLVLLAARSHDTDLARELCEHLAANGTWHTPTLAVLEAAALAGTDAFPLTGYLPHVEPYLRPIWEGANATTPDLDSQRTASELLDHQLQATGELHRAGVPLLAGTDTFVPGHSLHDELGLLVRAGLTPWDALRTATQRPAEFLGLAEHLGTIEHNKLADLVELRESPLHDIAHTRTIDTVILAGRPFDPLQLDLPA